MPCTCRHPRESADPRREGTCNSCGMEMLSGPEVVRDYLNRLSTCIPGWPALPDSWESFRALIEQRVANGQSLYGDQWRGKENITEAMEEAADLCAYSGFELAQNGRDADLALSAAWHAYKAAEALGTLRAKRTGVPEAIFEEEEPW